MQDAIGFTLRKNKEERKSQKVLKEWLVAGARTS